MIYNFLDEEEDQDFKSTEEGNGENNEIDADGKQICNGEDYDKVKNGKDQQPNPEDIKNILSKFDADFEQKMSKEKQETQDKLNIEIEMRTNVNNGNHIIENQGNNNFQVQHTVEVTNAVEKDDYIVNFS